MKILYISLFFASVLCNAQVAIGKSEITNTSAILDFNSDNDNTHGIILPAVETLPLGLDKNINGGTFVFDKNDSKIKMFENGLWKDMTAVGDNIKLVVNLSDETKGKVIIGANDTQADGVLVLESSDKALILPKIFRPHESVKSPYPGMMCYDTESDTLAIFDGKVWSYWE